MKGFKTSRKIKRRRRGFTTTITRGCSKSSRRGQGWMARQCANHRLTARLLQADKEYEKAMKALREAWGKTWGPAPGDNWDSVWTSPNQKSPKTTLLADLITVIREAERTGYVYDESWIAPPQILQPDEMPTPPSGTGSTASATLNIGGVPIRGSFVFNSASGSYAAPSQVEVIFAPPPDWPFPENPPNRLPSFTVEVNWPGDPMITATSRAMTMAETMAEPTFVNPLSVAPVGMVTQLEDGSFEALNDWAVQGRIIKCAVQKWLTQSGSGFGTNYLRQIDPYDSGLDNIPPPTLGARFLGVVVEVYGKNLVWPLRLTKDNPGFGQLALAPKGSIVDWGDNIIGGLSQDGLRVEFSGLALGQCKRSYEDQLSKVSEFRVSRLPEAEEPVLDRQRAYYDEFGQPTVEAARETNYPKEVKPKAVRPGDIVRDENGTAVWIVDGPRPPQYAPALPRTMSVDWGESPLAVSLAEMVTLRETLKGRDTPWGNGQLVKFDDRDELDEELRLEAISRLTEPVIGRSQPTESPTENGTVLAYTLNSEGDSNEIRAPNWADEALDYGIKFPNPSVFPLRLELGAKLSLAQCAQDKEPLKLLSLVETAMMKKLALYGTGYLVELEPSFCRKTRCELEYEWVEIPSIWMLEVVSEYDVSIIGAEEEVAPEWTKLEPSGRIRWQLDYFARQLTKPALVKSAGIDAQQVRQMALKIKLTMIIERARY